MATLLALVATIGIFCTPFYVIYKPPNALIRYFQRRWPDVLWQISTSSKIVALTIDDAPSEYTEQIMEVLKANNSTATFFVIGSQITGHESVLEELIRNGNELGNHAMNDEPSRSLPDAVLLEQIEFVQKKLTDAYNAVNVEGPPELFRPGSGFFSTRMQRLLAKLGYQLVLGSIFPFDPQIPYWTVNAHHILSMLRPGGIIICHDRRGWTVPMLQRVLPEMKRRGYQAVTVTELLKQATN